MLNFQWASFHQISIEKTWNVKKRLREPSAWLVVECMARDDISSYIFWNIITCRWCKYMNNQIIVAKSCLRKSTPKILNWTLRMLNVTLAVYIAILFLLTIEASHACIGFLQQKLMPLCAEYVFTIFHAYLAPGFFEVQIAWRPTCHIEWYKGLSRKCLCRIYKPERNNWTTCIKPSALRRSEPSKPMCYAACCFWHKQLKL